MINYRILHVADSVGISPMQDYCEKHDLYQLSYEDILQEFRDQGFIIPANWTVCMRQLGNESIEIIPPFLELQKHWCRENGVSFDESSETIVSDILSLQIKKLKPDVIFFYGGMIHSGISIDYVANLKSMFPFLKVVASFWGDYRWSSWYKSISSVVDILFACNKEYRDKSLSAGIKVWPIPVHSSFDHILYRQLNIKNVALEHNFVFAGATGYLGGLYLQRYENLLYLLKNTQLKCWATEPKLSLSNKRRNIKDAKNNLREGLKKITIDGMTNLDIYHLNKLNDFLRTKTRSTTITRLIELVIDKKQGTEEYKPAVFPYDYKPLSELYPSRILDGFIPNYFELLASAIVIFNAHRDEPADYSNIRIFEATGVGSCLITDKPDKVKQYFEPDEEILTYGCVEECVEKVRYVLDNENVRREIATKGQLRTMKEYTIMHHCEKIHAGIEKTI